MSKTVLIVGAGLSGAVIARQLAQAGHRAVIIEQRGHIAGNCHTRRDAQTGVMVHVYGPHIFHTDDEEVWRCVNAFERFMPYVNRVKTTSKGRVYLMPINLHTINQYRFQGIPENGYTEMIGKILDHPAIEIRLDTRFDKQTAAGHEHVFYSGPIDEYYGHDLGRLGYRTLDFETLRCQGDNQGCAVMNYADADVPYTRMQARRHV